MGGGDRTDETGVEGDTAIPAGGCCARACGGNAHAARVEGRNIVLGVTIVGMAVSGLLVYSGCQQLGHSSSESGSAGFMRFVVAVIAITLGAWGVLATIIALIGLCRFNDVDKIPFKLAFWLYLLQLWVYAAYIVVLLYFWDGNYSSGTLSVTMVKSASKTNSAASSTTTAFVELSATVSAVPADATRTWFAMLDTQLWFMSIAAVQILLSLLYLYGALRMRCKRMGKWGSSITAFWLLLIATGTLLFGALTIRFHPALVASTWTRPAPALLAVASQFAVAGLIAATAIYQLVISTQVSKLRLQALTSFNNLLIMTFVSAFAASASYYTYYESLHTSPRVDLLYFTALTGIASQVLLLGLGVQLVAWRYAIGEEYKDVVTYEKMLVPDDEADGVAFSPPPPQQQDS